MELYMLAFKTIQKYKLEYHGSPIKIDYTGIGLTLETIPKLTVQVIFIPPSNATSQVKLSASRNSINTKVTVLSQN